MPRKKFVYCDDRGREHEPPRLMDKMRALPETWSYWYKGNKASPRAMLLLLCTWFRLFFSPRRNSMVLFMYNDPTGKMTMSELRRMEMHETWRSFENYNLRALLNCPANKEHVDALKREGKVQEWHTLGMISSMIDERRFGIVPFQD